MAKERKVSDSTWRDAWFQSLSPNEKLIWLYLLTNEHLEISGIYEITVKTIYAEIAGDNDDIPRSEIKEILKRFSDSGKIMYEDNYIGLVNFHEHNKYLNNTNFETNINNAVNLLPPSILDKFYPVVFGEKQNAVETPSERRMNGNLHNTKYKTKTKDKTKDNITQPNITQPNANSLGSPPEPPPDYDPEAHTAELQDLSRSVEQIKTKRKTSTFKMPILTPEEIHAKFASGEYHTLDDTEYNETVRRAAELEAKNRAAGVQKVLSGIDSQIAAMDAKDPKWWKTWVNIPLTHITLLQAEFPDKDIMRYIKCIARTQVQSPKGKQVGEGYLKSALQGKWKPEGVK